MSERAHLTGGERNDWLASSAYTQISGRLKREGLDTGGYMMIKRRDYESHTTYAAEGVG